MPSGGFIATGYLKRPRVPFIHKDLIGTLAPCVTGRKAALKSNKERGEIILNKDALGYTVFHPCLSIIKHINFCLGLNTNWKIQRNQGTDPVPCYLVKELHISSCFLEINKY